VWLFTSGAKLLLLCSVYGSTVHTLQGQGASGT